jgi:maleate isomerase
MEPEFHEIALSLQKRISVHTARMRLDNVTVNGLKKMALEAKSASELLATVGVDVIVYGCTSGSLIGGVEWEKTLVNKIAEDTMIPTISTGRAVIDAIETMGGGRLGVATPYTENINHLEKIFFNEYGFEVSSIKGLGLINNLDIGRVSDDTIFMLIEEVAKTCDLIFISCTNLPVLHLIEKIEKMYNKPVITSNQASIWAALRRFNLNGINGYGQLLRTL